MSEAPVDSLYMDHAHLAPPDSLHPPPFRDRTVSHPRNDGGTARRVHRSFTPTASNRVTVSRGTTDARSLSRASPYPRARRADLSHRRERGPRTSCVSCVTPAPAPSDGSQRTSSYTSQQVNGACRGLCARLSALAVGCGLEVCAVPHRLLRAAGCSIRLPCPPRRCSTVRGGRTDAGGGSSSSKRQPRERVSITNDRYTLPILSTMPILPAPSK